MNSSHFASSSDTRKVNRTSNVNNVGRRSESSRFAHDDVAPERPVRGWHYVELRDRALMVDALSPSARQTLYWMVDAADSRLESDGYRSIMTTMTWLAQHTGQSTRNVRRHIRIIEALGILTDLVVGNNMNDQHHPNEWTFHPAQLVKLSPRMDNMLDATTTTRQLRRARHQANVAATATETDTMMSELRDKQKRNYATKATMPHIGLHHAVAARRAQQPTDDEQDQGYDTFDVDQWTDEHFTTSANVSDDWQEDVDFVCDDSNDPDTTTVVTVPSTIVTASATVVNDLTTDVRLFLGSNLVNNRCHINEHDEPFHLKDDQRAHAHARALDKYHDNTEEETANVAAVDAAFDAYLDDLAAQDSADAPTTQADHVAASANSTDPEQHLEGTLDLGSSNDNATATNTPAITAAEQITTTPTETTQAATNAAATQENTSKTKQNNTSNTKRTQPTPGCAAPSHERDAAVLAQRAPRNATQARQWSASLYRLATAHHDTVAATVAMVIASAWDGVGQALEHSQDPVKTMANMIGAQGPLELRFAVSVGEVIKHVSQAWRTAEAEHHGDEYPAMDTLEFAVKNWFFMRGGESFGTPIPRGELHGRLARYVGAVHRAEATGDSSFLPESAREKWLRRWQVRHRLTGSAFEKGMFRCEEEPEGWLFGWANANCIETATALDLWTQFRREHIDMMAQGWRMLFVCWWKARCVS